MEKRHSLKVIAARGAKQGRFLMLKYMLDTNNTREFERVPGIRLSDWTIQ